LLLATPAWAWLVLARHNERILHEDWISVVWIGQFGIALSDSGEGHRFPLFRRRILQELDRGVLGHCHSGRGDERDRGESEFH
jgi:hypothetical protein